ncbi:tripartite tricarboxylate transporter TctB family protein [Acuticoccus sp.]|uniref:tripartite tricarboxylate transporter TctB family protein n=1 Tax=Acuticoccus sp. TaxID=1904378 RepID=UPI003B52B836
MKLADWLLGLIIAASGVAIAARAQTFPSPSGQLYGAAFFPTLVGVGLAAIGVTLTARGLVGPSGPAIQLAPFLRSVPRAAKAVSPVVAVVAFIVLLPHLGFLATSILVVCPLMLLLGVQVWLALAVGVAASFAVQYAFGTLLRVALPYGVLERALF